MAFNYFEFVGDSTTIVDSVTSPIPTRTLGDQVTVGLFFRDNNRPTGYKDRYLEVKAYQRYADRADYGNTHEGDVWYQERLPADAPVNSNVVQIRPNPTDANGVFEGLWGLITGMDETNRLGNVLQLDARLFYLGDASDYADRTAVESALATSPVDA